MKSNLPLILGIAHVLLTIGSAVCYTLESKIAVPLMISAMTAVPLVLGFLAGRHHEQEKERRRRARLDHLENDRLAAPAGVNR